MKDKIRYETSMGKMSTDRNFEDPKKLSVTKFTFVIINSFSVPNPFHIFFCLTQVNDESHS